MRRSAVGGAAWTMGYGGTSGGGSAAGEPLESGTYQRAGAVPGEGEGDGYMTLSLIAAAVSFVLTLLIGRFLIPELRKLKAGQEIREDGPTWHKSKAGTPTMGGIMFILGAGVTVFILGWSFMLEGVFWHLYVYLFALIFGLIGFVDDYRKVRQHQNEGLTARQKFILQLAAAVVFLVLMRYEGLLTNDLYIPFLNMSFTINWIVYLIFAAFVIVGCVNAVNLTDGIDGLCSCVTVVYMAAFACISGILGMYCETLLALLTAGGCIGFLMWNFPPAKVFMGDTGSMFLGGVVCALGVGCGAEFLMLMAALVYICEALSVVIQVTVFKITKKIYHTKEGKRLFKMTPIHHHFELSGWSELKIDVVFSLTAAVLGAGAVLLAMNMFAR